MNHGPLIFLGVLASFVASWWALIFAPQLQIGSQPVSQTDFGQYPVRAAGLAQQGREVYVVQGCVQCHSQQVRQDGYTFDLVLTAAGTNSQKVLTVLAKVAPQITAEALAKVSDTAPEVLLKAVPQSTAEEARLQLKRAGATAQTVFVPLGPDMSRQWGARRSVAADYLYQQPVQIGNSRLGPELANVGARTPDANWHLLHLYHPRTVVDGSIMPAYPFLFETHPVGKKPSPLALKLPEKFVPKPGKDGVPVEVVPTPEALQLVAYLQSLRLDTPLFEAPATFIAPTVLATNAPLATNVPAAPNTPKQ